MTPALRRFRTVALLEGASFLLLLFAAMPLKYFAGLPMAVKVVGWAHGVLFIAYVVSLARVARAERWPGERGVFALVMGLVPFGAFVLDAQLRKGAPQPKA